MQKTKLGVSVAVMGAAMYFFGYFSGYTAMVLFAGYVLLMEENEWLKKTAVKAIATMVVFSLLSVLIGLIPNIFDFIRDICDLFGGYVSFSVIFKIQNLLNSALRLVEAIVFLLLGLKALRQGTIKVPVVDSLVNKSME